MNHFRSTLIFISSLALALYFVVHTSAQLPTVSAVHFDAAGTANSYMPRAQYVRFMCGFAVGLPVFIVTVSSLVYARARSFKVPNRDYWMAPERAPATRSFLIGHAIGFGTLLAGLLCLVHWMVILANREQPPHLSNSLAIGGLLIFAAAIVGWAMVLVVAFRRPA